MALGIYHNPEIWFGPFSQPSPGSSSHDESAFGEIVAERQVDTISVRVSRDGLFVFDFSGWPEYVQASSKRPAKQIEIINTYLLCFYSAAATRGLWVHDTRRSMMMMRANRANIIGVSSSGGYYGTIGPSDDLLRLMARRGHFTNLSMPALLDSPIPERTLEISFELFSGIWQRRHEKIFTFADLLLGAHVAHFNLRFAEALTLAWLVIETFLDMLWSEYLERNRTRDGKAFINKGRKETLEDHRPYSASVQIEILSLLEEIPFDLYQALTEIRKVRNRWIHGLGSVEPKESEKAIQIAERSFRERYDFQTTLPPYRLGGFVSGGEYIDKDKPLVQPPMRETTFNKPRVHVTGLDRELRKALGEHTSGLSYNGQTVRVHMLADAPQADEKLAAQVIEAHDPAFLTIDDAHRVLPGEYKFDGPRHQPHVKGDGEDAAIITIELPHTKKPEITLLRNKKPEIVKLKDGVGQLSITSNEPLGTCIIVSVQDHPCDKLAIEVIAPPDPS